MGSIFGGGGSSGTATSSTSNDVTVNTQTDVNIDLVPLGEILAQSQISSSKIISSGQNQVAQIDRETAQINIINSELDRQANSKALSKLDGYLEHAKNGIVLSVIVAGVLYANKNKSKKRKKK